MKSCQCSDGPSSDPLDLEYQALIAKALLYGRSDLQGADALLADVVAHHPTYTPALGLLADVRMLEGRFADAAMYNEQFLKLDPLDAWVRWALISDYVNAGDMVAAQKVAEEAPHPLPINRILLVMHQGDWHQAAQMAYAALDDGTMLAHIEPWAVFSVRMDVRNGGDFRRARAALEKRSGVTWTASGIPVVPTQLSIPSSTVALGDVLIAGGDRARGEKLLRASLVDMDYVIHDLRRGDLWYLGDQAIALMLLGDRKGALATLRKAQSNGSLMTHCPIEIDPALAGLRADPEFQALVHNTGASSNPRKAPPGQLARIRRITQSSTPRPATGMGHKIVPSPQKPRLFDGS